MSARCPCKGSSSSSSSRDCETLLIVLRSCLGSTLGPSPPVATVEMDKGEGRCGNGGNDKKETRWPRAPGSYAYLKNFRRGLLHQRKRALRDMQADEDDKKSEAQRRWLWIMQKHYFLDYCHEMIFDEPVTLEGKETQYGSMEENARRGLTEEEVRWNTKFIKQEAGEQRRGFALVATPSTPAPATPPWRTKRREAVAVAPMHVDSRQSGRSFGTKKTKPVVATAAGPRSASAFGQFPFIAPPPGIVDFNQMNASIFAPP